VALQSSSRRGCSEESWTALVSQQRLVPNQRGGQQTHEGAWTERKMLANVASIYDSLELLGPVIMQCKLFIQVLWQQELDWDSRLPSELRTRWLEIHQMLLI
jgi:hypothetical protein